MTALQILLVGFAFYTGILTQESQPESSSAENGLSYEKTRDLLNDLMHNNDYRIRPNFDGNATLVRCGIFIISFGSISESDMDYTMDIFLRQHWNDQRLKYNVTKRSLSINPRVIDHIWTPDVYFPSEKKASIHSITVPNRLMKVSPNGNVMYSMRLTLTMACPMDLTHFPMDHQECEFNIESYGNDVEDLVLKWFSTDPIEIEEDIELPQFDLERTEEVACKDHVQRTGKFSCLKAKFSLARQYGFFLLQTYIPSILIVIISWVSFWINMDAVPARISLGVTTVLTMATQLSGSKGSIPRISYPKAIDIWMSVCMTFVFAALIEYALITSLARNEPKKKDKDEEQPEEEPESSILDRLARRRTAEILDKCSRFFFPGAFLFFNIVYWPYFIRDVN